MENKRHFQTFEGFLNEKKPKGAPDFHHSDAPDANGRFRDLSIKDLAKWLIDTRKGDVKKISGSLTQQYVFNRNDDPKYAEKMQKTRKEVYKQLDRQDLIDAMEESFVTEGTLEITGHAYNIWNDKKIQRELDPLKFKIVGQMDGVMTLSGDKKELDKVRAIFGIKESVVTEGKDDFMARYGSANINLKKGYKHHTEEELNDLYDKLGDLVKTLKVKDVTLVFESVVNEAKEINEKVDMAESHFKVGDKVKMSHGGTGIIVSLDKEDEKYYNVELPNGEVHKHSPSELTKESIEINEKMKVFMNSIIAKMIPAAFGASSNVKMRDEMKAAVAAVIEPILKKYDYVVEGEERDTLAELNDMTMGQLERIEDYAEMIADRMEQGQQLDSWMFAEITQALNGLNSVHDAMDGDDGIKEGFSMEDHIAEMSNRINEKAKGDRGPLDNAAVETGLKNKSKASGVPLPLLRLVMRRGMGAWNSGHRQGMGQEQWGYARVNAFLEKGEGTWQGADKDIAKEVRDGGHDSKLPYKED